MLTHSANELEGYPTDLAVLNQNSSQLKTPGKKGTVNEISNFRESERARDSFSVKQVHKVYMIFNKIKEKNETNQPIICEDSNIL